MSRIVPRPSTRWSTAPAALLLLACALPVAAQTPGDDAAPTAQAHRLQGPAGIDLDGHLDDVAWDRARPMTDFVQVEPREGAEPSERTVVRIVYDEDALYIGAKLFGDPGAILAYQRRRDAGLGTDDRFMWILDTFRDGRTGYFFEINPAGLMGDGLLGGGHFGVNKSWDGVWEARTARLEDGWSAEIRIPFSTLNFDPADDTWGINFQRTIRHRNEEIRWAGPRRNQRLTEPAHAGTLTGIEGVSQGVGVEVTPYAVQNWRQAPGAQDPNRFPGDVGFDVGYSLTPSLRGALSVNTDFAEVEVDQRRVNLTRFPLYFPEQRDFFLEGSGVYSFAPRSGPTPYFSRRIGLRQGEAVPIDFGGRLGGQAGPYELGFLQVRTAATDAFGREDFTVARAKRAILERSTLGAIYTRRATGPGPDGVAPPDRHTFGVDLDYATSHLLGDQNFEMEAFAVWNSNPDPDVSRDLNDLTARGFRFNFPNDLWQAHLSYREFGPAYNPAVGFVRRNDFRRVEPRVAWRPRPEFLAAVRQVTFAAQFRYLESLTGGVVEERRWDLDLADIEFESGDRLEVEATQLYEYLDRSFEVADGIQVLPGAYRTWEQSVSLSTAGRRPLSLDAELSHGGFWDGDRTGLELGLTARPLPGISASVDYNRNEITLPRGAFDTNLLRLNTSWDLSPWTSLRTSVQYDDVSEVLGLFGLLRWIIRPGNEVFLVYTHNWLHAEPGQDALDPRFITLSRGASAKIVYSFRW
ncbi:MAG: DUF5916 domain-containing protein [Longimicrobiales bacterium]|nr:DUF5916 domain-containing protein [Longimicrobiales bacterium]